MKYTLVLNVRTASEQSSAVNIDLPIEGLDAINAFGVVVREVVETVCGVTEHVVTREELLALNASVLNGQEAVIRAPVINWTPVFAIANAVVSGLNGEPKEVPILMSSCGIWDGTGVFRMENEKSKRLYLVFPDQDEAYDVDDGNGGLDGGKMREAVSEVVDNFDSSDIEDIVYDICNMGDSVEIDCGDDYRSYEKKDILDAMGDWESFVDSQREAVVMATVDSILEEWQCNGAEGSADDYVCAHFEMRVPEDEEDD